jgi:hypothetical protein
VEWAQAEEFLIGLAVPFFDGKRPRIVALPGNHDVSYEDLGGGQRLIVEAAGAFPEKVTASRPGMAVHGRYGEPCSRCGTQIQRIRYASNETNYCPTCQTGSRLLADRALSRLLHEDWPRTLDKLEALKRR